LQSLKKKEIPIIEKDKFTKVCIDDFALKKRKKYGTIMVDIESRRIIDLLESREINDVIEWLKTYPNLKIISRDGSISYAAAISNAHPKVVQVSDRFHLFKNLTDYCKKYILKTIGIKVRIPTIKEDTTVALLNKNGYNSKSKKDKISNVKELHQKGLTKHEIRKQLKMDIRTIEKYIGLEDDSEEIEDKDTRFKKHDAIVSKKEGNIARVKELHKQNYSNSAIARETGLSRHTVKRYLDTNVSPVHGAYGTYSGGPLTPFHDDINKLLSKGWTFKKIEEFIRGKGYGGSSSTIRMYTTRERRLFKQIQSDPEKTELVKRQYLIKLLYKPIEKINKLTSDQLSKVLKIYPMLEEIYKIITSFKELVFSKNVAYLDKWIAEAQALNIDEINSFTAGISRDIEAVKNAIIYDYSNGLAEGSVNKLKVIKRIMYGRNNFDMLRKKVLLLENRRKIN
jgi:transposase